MSSRLADNLVDVRSRIAAAAQRSGRAPDAVTLIAVTKYVGLEATRAVIDAGCRDLGESRPQELWQKAAALQETALAGPPIRWHMIGHLQRNKTARTVPLVSLIHSGDSLRILEALDASAADLGRKVPVLLEINISGDATKHGFVPTEIEPLLEPLAARTSLDVRGLMAMAGREGDLDSSRREFAQLRELRDRLRTSWHGRFDLPELSMGMSGDYEVAIEEGATIVRVGSALFEGLDE
jgi:pyridoxal phosphate enzyme (YggS family)